MTACSIFLFFLTERVRILHHRLSGYWSDGRSCYHPQGRLVQGIVCIYRHTSTMLADCKLGKALGSSFAAISRGTTSQRHTSTNQASKTVRETFWRIHRIHTSQRSVGSRPSSHQARSNGPQMRYHMETNLQD